MMLLRRLASIFSALVVVFTIAWEFFEKYVPGFGDGEIRGVEPDHGLSLAKVHVDSREAFVGIAIRIDSEFDRIAARDGVVGKGERWRLGRGCRLRER